MTLREFARLVETTPSNVSKGCRTGRLLHSVTRGRRGRVLSIEPKLGAREWVDNASPARQLGAQLGKPPRVVAPRLPKAEIDALSKDLGSAMREWIRYLGETVAGQAPAAVAGALEALQAAGRPATAAAVRAAFELDDPDDSDPVALAAEQLLSALGDPDLEPAEAARAAGREAVTGHA